MGSWRDRWREELDQRLRHRGGIPGVSVGEGWKDLICDLVEKLDATGVEWRPTQIKEKLGALRFYVDIEEEPSLQHVLTFTDYKAKIVEARKLIDEAAEKSATICWRCGKSGTMVTVAYLLEVLCSACAIEVDIERREKKRREKERQYEE